MKKEDWKKIFYQSLTGFVSLALAILLFFAIQGFGEIRHSFLWLLGVLKPVIYGAVMAYLLKTPCNFLEQRIANILPDKHKKRANALTVLLVLILTFLVIYLLMSMVIPEMVSSTLILVNAVPQKMDEFAKWLTGMLDGNEMLQTYANTAIINVEHNLQDWAKTDLLPTMQGMMGGFADTVGSVVGILYNLLIGIIICIYLLLGRKTFARQGKAVLYAVLKSDRADAVMKELQFIDKTFVGFFGGKILDSAIVGLICYVFCIIMTFTMGFPNAVLISVIVGVTNVIPYFGPYIGAVPSALLVLISGPVNCIIFIVFIIVLQQFDGNILGPSLLADSVGLTGFWVLFSITLFQGFFGFVGILVGVPVFAVIYDMIRRMVVRGLKKHGKTALLLETEPAGQQPEEKPSI
ncbi:MAG: AI-2E family transporter [Eubacterium sp.]|nr:AI-2E family transporter [Eubacterium sp.]